MQLSERLIICDHKQKFSCSNCDDNCCKSFSIKIDDKTKIYLEQLDYIRDKLNQSKEQFEPTKDGKFYLPIILKDNRYQCLFYSEGENCLIHAKDGYDAKPVSCQLFPFFMFLDARNNVHIETSFRCKSILENYGTNIEDIKESIVKQYLNLEHYPYEFSLYDKLLTQEEVFKLAENLKKIINDSNLSLDETILNYFSFLKSFKKLYVNKESIDVAVEESLKTNYMETSKPRTSAISKYIINIYLTNLLLYSTYTRKKPLFKHALRVLLNYIYLYLSLINLKQNAKLPSIENLTNLRDISKVNFQPDEQTISLIKRYLTSNLIRHKYLTNDKEDLQFFNRVILYYILIKSLSRIMALSKNSYNVDYKCVADSITLIELVFYHANIPLLPTKSSEKMLSPLFCNLFNDYSMVKQLINYPAV